MSSPDASRQFELDMAGLARKWRDEPGLFLRCTVAHSSLARICRDHFAAGSAFQTKSSDRASGSVDVRGANE